MATTHSSRDGCLAIDGGDPVITRKLNHYRGAATIGEDEKRAVMEVLDSQSLQWG